MKRRTKVALLQRVITHYRFPLYEHVAEYDDIDVTCYHSRGHKNGPPAIDVKMKMKEEKVSAIYRPGSFKALYQGVILRILSGKYDVVICVHEMGNMSPLILWLLRKVFRYKFIWWGMGYDLSRMKTPDERPETLRGKIAMFFKDILWKHADALMAYSKDGKSYSDRLGIDPRKVFVLHNTLDVKELQLVGSGIAASEILELREQLGIAEDTFVFLFMSRLHKRKQVPFLIRAFAEVVKKRDNVKLVIVGDGEEREHIESLVREFHLECDIKVVGEIYDSKELAKYFKLSEVFVMTGQVGLSICHSFAYGVPIITRAASLYTPELEFLENEVNGIRLIDSSTDAFAEVMVRMYDKPDLVSFLSKGAFDTAKRMSMENMASRFRDAILFAADVSANVIEDER